jgi:hypothetical protein
MIIQQMNKTAFKELLILYKEGKKNEKSLEEFLETEIDYLLKKSNSKSESNLEDIYNNNNG